MRLFKIWRTGKNGFMVNCLKPSHRKALHLTSYHQLQICTCSLVSMVPRHSAKRLSRMTLSTWIITSDEIFQNMINRKKWLRYKLSNANSLKDISPEILSKFGLMVTDVNGTMTFIQKTFKKMTLIRTHWVEWHSPLWNAMILTILLTTILPNAVYTECHCGECRGAISTTILTHYPSKNFT